MVEGLEGLVQIVNRKIVNHLILPQMIANGLGEGAFFIGLGR